MADSAISVFQLGLIVTVDISLTVSVCFIFITFIAACKISYETLFSSDNVRTDRKAQVKSFQMRCLAEFRDFEKSTRLDGMER